ncbi:MAG: hypothetical protein IKO64_00425 [Kiritimatiellae bacterium]|nr:hypothetical protein [Kiritimatiellia bacterium]
MAIRLDKLFVASALGVGNAETWANYRAHNAPGMQELPGDIPGRAIWFGTVPFAGDEALTRTNQLLKLAYDNLADAIAALKAKYGAARVAIVLGASNTGIDEAENHVDKWLDSGDKPAAMDFSMIELGTPSLYLKQLAGTSGPAYTVSTACSSATKAFAAARRLIEAGHADAAIVGGVDGRCRFAMNGFHALGALSAGRCRPLAADRDGINLGEGVALFTMERDVGRVELSGAGESSDAYHATSPDPEGRGAEAAMAGALRDAGLNSREIDYINLHGTGTVANDDMEMKAVRRVFGETLPVYESTKDLTGHCLGAAGAVEAAICYLRIANGLSKSCLSASFAFGGSNAAIVLHA